MVRFLKLVEPALQILPEVAMPERKVCCRRSRRRLRERMITSMGELVLIRRRVAQVPFRERCLWTVVVLFIFLVSHESLPLTATEVVVVAILAVARGLFSALTTKLHLWLRCAAKSPSMAPRRRSHRTLSSSCGCFLRRTEVRNFFFSSLPPPTRSSSRTTF